MPAGPPFAVELVAASNGAAPTSSGVALPVHRSIADPGRDGHRDRAVAPRPRAESGCRGRYPDLVAWLRRVHGEGALVCSACSGVLLIAETGLLSGREATMHPAYAATFRGNFPDVRLRLERDARRDRRA